MLFNSYVFCFAFFPIALLVYFAFNAGKKHTAAQISLILCSLFFYGYFKIEYLAILVLSIVVNYLLSRILSKRKTGTKAVLVLGIIANVAVIFYFKYFNFFIDNINALFKTGISVFKILMPLGISFFTFQQIAFLVDSYRGETRDYNFIEYALYVSFFPQLIAGPIVLHSEMIPQFRDLGKKRLNAENCRQGLYRFAIGMTKKVIMADTLAKAVDWGYENYRNLGSLNLILVAFFYSLQLYLDFSGYCDMACGIAKCFNLDIPDNFNLPYKSTSIADFWRKWHMTLTRFLTTYVYIPLGGSRKGYIRTLVNIIIVFLISGIWHGANWTFIVWGLIHGALSVLYRITNKIWDRIVKPVRIIANFIVVTFAWIFFRSDSLKDAGVFIKNIFVWNNAGITAGFFEKFDILELTYIEDHIPVLKNLVSRFPAVNMIIVSVVILLFVFVFEKEPDTDRKYNAWNALVCAALLIWSIVSLSGVSTFLYFNF